MAEGDAYLRLHSNYGLSFPDTQRIAMLGLVMNIGSTFALVYYRIPARGWGSVLQEEVAAQPPVPSPQFRIYIEITA
jgi:hypothetical protein